MMGFGGTYWLCTRFELNQQATLLNKCLKLCDMLDKDKLFRTKLNGKTDRHAYALLQHHRALWINKCRLCLPCQRQSDSGSLSLRHASSLACSSTHVRSLHRFRTMCVFKKTTMFLSTSNTLSPSSKAFFHLFQSRHHGLVAPKLAKASARSRACE